MPALVIMKRMAVSVDAPRAVTPMRLPLKSAMNAGQGLPAFGAGMSVATTICSRLDTRLPVTIFTFAPFLMAPMMTSAGAMAESMLLASIACTPSGAAGITCNWHLMPYFSQYAFGDRDPDEHVAGARNVHELDRLVLCGDRRGAADCKPECGHGPKCRCV